MSSYQAQTSKQNTISDKEAHEIVFKIYRRVMAGYNAKDPYAIAIVEEALL